MNGPKVVAAVLGAAALAVPITAKFEGYRNRVYADPAPGAFTTVCYGQRVSAAKGTVYTDQQCVEMLAQSLAQHGIEIAPCLPDDLPPKTRAAFIDFGYNVGVEKFCGSTLSIKALAGDLRGACNEFPRWTYAGKEQLPGLVKRRAAEQALCLEGLQ